MRSGAARASSVRSSFGHVVVIGGSVAGLLTAHVLSKHADRVTVVERDHYANGPRARAGVPQSRHTHVLLTSGIRALDDLLPDLEQELRAAGAPSLSVPADLGVWQAGQWVARHHPSEPVLTASRPLLEYAIRRCVLTANPGIDVLTSTDATGLVREAGQYTGVVVRERGAGRDGMRQITADLVVDAAGRSSKTPEWLTKQGDDAPAEEVLETGRAYASCAFHAGSVGHAEHLSGFYIVPDAAQTVGAIMLPAENDRVMVTLSGPRGHAPPTDPGGFVEFARGLPHEAPYRWLREALPASRPVGYRHTGNRRRRYDRAPRARTGLLVVGDALCAFNPVYGQGLSVAAMNAVAVDRALRSTSDTPSTRTLQRMVLKSADGAWEVATGADTPMPGSRGNALRVGPINGFVNWYLERVKNRVPGDPVVCSAFRDVLFLLTPPRKLLTSHRVLRRSLLYSTNTTSTDELPTL